MKNTENSITLNFNASQVSPIVNLNGNSKESLVNEWQEFMNKLQDVADALPYESFHGRNHYLRNEEEQPIARECRMEMGRALQALHQLASDIQMEVSKQ